MGVSIVKELVSLFCGHFFMIQAQCIVCNFSIADITMQILHSSLCRRNFI